MKRSFVENMLALLAVLTILAVFGGAIALIVIGRPASDSAALETPAERAERCARAPKPRLTFARKKLEPLIEGDSLAKAGQITPVLYPGGETARGFRIVEIQPGGFYDLVGLCDGDLIVAVAGERLDTPEAAFDVYEKAKGMTEIQVRLLRGANTATISYTVALE